MSGLSAEQLAARRNAIGGSDCAAALGLSKWKTMRQLFHEKRGELPLDDEDTLEKRLGLHLEPFVRQWYAEETQFVVQQPAGTLVHPDYPFLVGHIDGFSKTPAGMRGYEGKWSVRSVGWGLEGTDQIPIDYFFQVQHYLMLTKWPVWDVVCLVGARFLRHQVHADESLSQYVLDGELEFIRRVRENDPPPLDSEHPTALELMKRVFPGTDGSIIPAPPEALEWRVELLEAVALENEAKKAKNGLRAKMLELMGSAALLEFPDGQCLRRQRVDKCAYTVAASSYMDLRFVAGRRSRSRHSGR